MLSDFYPPARPSSSSWLWWTSSWEFGFDICRMMDSLRCLVRIGLVCPVCGGAQWHGGCCDLGRHLTWPPPCSAVQPKHLQGLLRVETAMRVHFDPTDLETESPILQDLAGTRTPPWHCSFSRMGLECGALHHRTFRPLPQSYTGS